MAVPKIEINNDILRIGANVYAIKRIQATEVDLNKELKELYNKRYETHMAQLNEGCVQTVIKDWDTQIERLRKFEGRNAKAIPQNMFDKPVMYRNNMLLELRAVIYSPHEVVGMRQDTRFNMVRRAIDTALPFVTNPHDNETLAVTIKAPFAVPVLYGYDQHSLNLYTPMTRTYHTHSDGRVCTGNHTGKDFWDLTALTFNQEVNRINLFSPACNYMEIDGVRYDLSTLVNPTTFVSVRRRGVDTWNVSH